MLWLNQKRIELNFNRSRRTHYYNNIVYTKSPFYLSLFIFIAILSGIMFNAKIEYLVEYAYVPLLLFVAYIFTWINELKSESVYYGRYNSKIRMSLMVGFILFLVSEAMLFFGFFWTFFDRLFALPAHVPQVYTIEHINCTGAPLLGTVLLILSGYCANLAFYQADSYRFSYRMHKISILLGMAFLAIQVYEYQELMSSISYNVFYSIFFVLTGFHGFHVIIGLLFLIINDYIVYYNYSSYEVTRILELGRLSGRWWGSIFVKYLPYKPRSKYKYFKYNPITRRVSFVGPRTYQVLAKSGLWWYGTIWSRRKVHKIDFAYDFWEPEGMLDFYDETKFMEVALEMGIEREHVDYLMSDLSEEDRERVSRRFTYDKPMKL